MPRLYFYYFVIYNLMTQDISRMPEFVNLIFIKFPEDPPDIESNNLALQAPTRSDSFEFWRSSHRLLRRCPRVSRHLHSLRDPKGNKDFVQEPMKAPAAIRRDTIFFTFSFETFSLSSLPQSLIVAAWAVIKDWAHCQSFFLQVFDWQWGGETTIKKRRGIFYNFL
jgi:hypothetical protein